MDEKSVLIVEDDLEIAQIVSVNVKDLGLQTELAADGKTGLEKALSGRFSLIILDVMLPEMDGISLCRSIRNKDQLTPVLMLTARAEEIDRVLGLELGADDYMTKPFSVLELRARIKALLRRSRTMEEQSGSNGSRSIIEIGSLSVNLEKRQVYLKNRELNVTVKEFDLLALFMQNPGRAFNRSELLNQIWGYSFEGYEHTVNTHINRLRNKIETDPANPLYLKTVWGMGYRFAEEKEFK